MTTKTAAGAHSGLPEGLEFEVRGAGMVVAKVNGEYAGSLQWFAGIPNVPDRSPGEVIDIRVDPKWRRRGIATAMWEKAKTLPFPPTHSPNLTEDGRAWSQTVGSKTAAVTLRYARNPASAGDFGSRFGQDIEPDGRYLTASDTPPPGWESGTITFTNPLVLDFGGGYTEPSNWKRVLSNRYGGKTGRALSAAIVADGYDGIITRDSYGTSEIVDLTGFTRTAAAGGTIWRGLRVPVTDEVRTLAKSYWEEHEVSEHRSAKIGQIFLDLMASHVGNHSGAGLGIHWSTRPEMADVAAETSGQRSDWPVIIEATYTASDVVPEGDPLYGLSGVWQGNGIEAEVLIKPGARLTVTGLWLAEEFAGTNIFSVDNCPKMNIRGTKYRNVLTSPQQRTAGIRGSRKVASTEGVYAAERALPDVYRMRAVTDQQAAKIATGILGKDVTILRTNNTPGGSLEPGGHIFGVWIHNRGEDVPCIVAPPGYPLSEFEVYHETAHLLVPSAGHDQEFIDTYLRIAPSGLAQALRAQLVKQAGGINTTASLALSLDPSGDPTGSRMVWNARVTNPVSDEAGTLAGYLAFDSSGPKVKIKALEVNPAYQRQGVGTWLLNQFLNTFNRDEVDAGQFTPAGAALWARVTGEHPTSSTEMTLPNNRDWRHGAKTADSGGPIEYLVRVEFGRRRDIPPPPEDGPNPVPLLDIHAGERFVWVTADSATEAKSIALEIVMNGSDKAGNPIAHTGDMPTKAEVVQVLAGRSQGVGWNHESARHHRRAPQGRGRDAGPAERAP